MKIVQAVNAMLANRDKITGVQSGRNSAEYFFLYGEYKWSGAPGGMSRSPEISTR